MTTKIDKRLPLNVDQHLIASIDQHRRTLESQSGLRISRNNAAVSLIRAALAASDKAPPAGVSA